MWTLTEVPQIGDLKVPQEAHATAIAEIFKSFHEIFEALEYIAKNQTKIGDAGREANNIAHKM